MDSIKVYHLDVATDDRGQIEFVNSVSLAPVKRMYIVSNHVPGFVRAWHGHMVESKFAMLLSGSALMIVIPIDVSSTDDYRGLLHNDSTSIPMVCHPRTLVWIPPGYAHGFKLLTPDSQMLFLSTSTLEESRSDDIRFSAGLARHLWEVEER